MISGGSQSLVSELCKNMTRLFQIVRTILNACYDICDNIGHTVRIRGFIMRNNLPTRRSNPRVPTQFPVTVLTARRQSLGQVVDMSDTSMKIILNDDLILNQRDDIALSFSGGRVQGFMHRNEFYGQIIWKNDRDIGVYFGSGTICEDYII